MRFKVTFVFQSNIFSPTESYISSDSTPINFTAALQRLITQRNFILPSDVSWEGVRIGQHDVKRRSKIHRPGIRFPFSQVDAGLNIPKAGGLALPPGQQIITKVSLLIAKSFDGDRASKAYLSCVPDAVISDDEDRYDAGAFPAFNDALRAYTEEVTNSDWAVFARVVGAGAPDIVIQAWTQPDLQPGNMAVTIAGAPPAALTVPYPPVIVRNVRRRGTDRTSYNGTYTVSSVNTTLSPGNTVIFLHGTEAGDPASVKRNGTIQVKTWAYYDIENLEPIQGTTRKRGNSAAAARGTSRKSNFLVR